jgi:hypothetical protein
MTIDNTWLSCFKEEAVEAFSDSCPFRPQAVFSDGQIRLMQSPPMQPQTWDEYIYKRFVNHYKYFLQKSPVLVVAFDNYTYVPVAKSMTQISRRKHVPTIPFSTSCPLPCMVPEGETWMQLISNRTFKLKLIELLAMKLPKLLLTMFPDKTIIIDYDVPCKYTMDSGTVLCEVMSDLPPLGEADVKFTRWADKYEKLLVDSIDGDSVPIALMHFERKLMQEVCPPKIAIYRYKVNIQAKQPAAKKAKTTADTTGAGTSAAKKKGKEYEYLDIHTLFLALQQGVKQTIGMLKLQQHEGHEIRMIIALITLTGTDFSRHLAQVSGKSIWDMLVSIWIPLMASYDPLAQQFRTSVAMNKLIPKIYCNKFNKILPQTSMNYEQVHSLLMHAPKMADRTKKSIPSPEQIETTIKNCNWVLQYWMCEPYPNPVSEQFGYKQVDGKVSYSDIDMHCI